MYEEIHLAMCLKFILVQHHGDEDMNAPDVAAFGHGLVE
jgi:hypothetical protein